MHELTLANKIIEEAKKQAGQKQAEDGDQEETESRKKIKALKIKSLTIEVGDLAHLPAEDMEKTLHDLVDWKINVIRKPAQVKCSCNFRGEPKILERSHDLTIFECPQCSQIPEILEGQNIILKQVEVE